LSNIEPCQQDTTVDGCELDAAIALRFESQHPGGDWDSQLDQSVC
jgi:hypothetical protein